MKRFTALLVTAVFMSLAAVSIFAQPEVIKHRPNPHSNSPKDTGYALTAGGTGALSPMTYGNGALIPTPNIYLIWYGNWNQSNGSDTPAGQQIVRDFVSNIGGSPYFHLNTSLSAGVYTITGNAYFKGETTSTGTSTRLRDSDILSIVNTAISNKKLPSDPSGIYFVLTSSNVAESSGFCTQYCGWHTSASSSLISNGKVRYSFVGNANRCLSSCAAQSVSPNGNAGVDGMISVLAHELEETTTDADPRSGWADSSGAENGDKCAWTFGSAQYAASIGNGSWANMHLGTRDYLIQRNIWQSNGIFDCRVDQYTH